MDSSVSDKTRLDGLDTLRAIAIIIVLIYHYKVVVSPENLFGFISSVGWTGVDLFFVLSGYLIGNQILSAFSKGQDFSLKLFYIRRFLRTLPNYYFCARALFHFSCGARRHCDRTALVILNFHPKSGIRSGRNFYSLLVALY